MNDTPDRDPAIVALHHALDMAEPITEPRDRERRVSIVQARALVSIAERLGQLVELSALRVIAANPEEYAEPPADPEEHGDEGAMPPTLASVLPLVDLGTTLTVRDDPHGSESLFTVTGAGTSEGEAWAELTNEGGVAFKVWVDATLDAVVLTIDGVPAAEALAAASEARDEANSYAEAMGAELDAATPAEEEELVTVHVPVDLDASAVLDAIVDDPSREHEPEVEVEGEPAIVEPVADHRGSFFDDDESGPDDD